MSKLKYIKLFEEHNESSTWSTIRDAVQSKKPFAIIVCADDKSCAECKVRLRDFVVIDQRAYTAENNENLEYNSIFVILNKDTDFDAKIKTLFNDLSIKKIIEGKSGDEFFVEHYDAKTSQNMGNELVSEISPQSMPPDDYFKIDSTYYKFINFNV